MLRIRSGSGLCRKIRRKAWAKPTNGTRSTHRIPGVFTVTAVPAPVAAHDTDGPSIAASEPLTTYTSESYHTC